MVPSLPMRWTLPTHSANARTSASSPIAEVRTDGSNRRSGPRAAMCEKSPSPHPPIYNRANSGTEAFKIRPKGGWCLEPSEIRPVGLRNRRDLIAVVRGVVGLANVFFQWAAVDTPPMLDRRPGHVESARIVNGDEHLQRLAAVDHLETLDDVQLFGVGGAIIVDERPVIQPDRVDNQ